MDAAADADDIFPFDFLIGHAFDSLRHFRRLIFSLRHAAACSIMPPCERC